MAKVVVLKETSAVLGMHIASPNAGEIIQGFAVAFRKGLVYQVRAGERGGVEVERYVVEGIVWGREEV
jgi:Pyridine nucleotide-disulphide oxidoreductase, dimerisation domain